jgi:hypothetical protein
MNRYHTPTVLAVLASVALIGTGCGGGAVRTPSSTTTTATGHAVSSPATQPVGTPSSADSIASGSAVAVLAVLPVKGRAAKTGYSRAQFGQAWADVDRNGCDTRNDVLRRDLTGVAVKAGTHGCLVLTGTLRDPYTAT